MHICPDELQPLFVMWDHIRLAVAWCWCKIRYRIPQGEGEV